MKPKLILCLALVLSGLLFGCSNFTRAEKPGTNAEPRYLDKSLSEWIPLAWLQGVLLIPGDKRATAAVRQIGTNAIPWLLQWLRSADPETARLGVEGFYLLGPVAKPAVPELLKMAGGWQASAAWSNAISALASLRDTNGLSYTFPYLVPLATNQSAPADVRARTVESMANIGYNASAVPVFIQCLQDRDWRVARAAANGLGRWPIEPKLAIPALAACLMSRTNATMHSAADDDPYHWHGDASVRESAAGSLLCFAELIHYPSSRSRFELDTLRQAMSTAVPALVKALDDEDWRVVRDSATALGDSALQPDTAVPALIKSLHHPHYSVRQSAATALGEYGPAARSAVASLTVLEQDDWVGGWAERALQKITTQTNR